MENIDSNECVLRGGSWYDDPREVRGAARHECGPHYGFGGWGFRLALTIQEESEESEDDSPCVLRGSSWSIDPRRVRGAARTRGAPHAGYWDVGFRLAMDIP